MPLRFFTLLFLISISFHFINVNAQNRPDFDSIRAEISTAKNERDRINSIIRLGNAFRPSQADSIFYYAEQLAMEPDTNKLAAAGKVFLEGVALSKSGRLEEARAPLIQSIKIFRELEDFELYFIASNHLGQVYSRNKNYKKALELYHSLLSEEGKFDNHMKLVVNGNLGIIHRRLGSFYKAVSHFEKTVALNPHDPFSIANAQMQISSIYLMLEFPERALATLNKIPVDSLAPSPIKIAVFNNKGEVFNRLGKIDSAIFYFIRGIELGNKIRQYHQVVRPSAALLRLYGKSGNLDKAQEVFRAVAGLCPKYCPPPVNLDLLLASGEHMLNLKKYDEAIKYFSGSVELLSKVKPADQFQDIYLLMSRAYEQKGEQDKAMAYQKKHIHFKDSLKSLVNDRYIAEARIKFQANEQAQKLNRSEAERSLFQNLFVQMVIIALTLMAGGLFFYKRYRHSTNMLSLREDEIAALNEQLADRKQHAEKVDIFPKYLVLKSKAKIDLEQLIFVYVDGHYLEYFMQNRERPEIDRNSLSSIMEDLPQSQFVRVHRSFVVNINYIKAIYASRLLLENGKEVPVSRTFKANIEDMLLKPASSI